MLRSAIQQGSWTGLSVWHIASDEQLQLLWVLESQCWKGAKPFGSMFDSGAQFSAGQHGKQLSLIRADALALQSLVE